MSTTETLDSAGYPGIPGPQLDRLANSGRSDPVARAQKRALSHLRRLQHAEGFWCGELQGDTILESEYVLLQGWLGRSDSLAARQAAAYLVDQQLEDGGWAPFPGGGADASGSVKAYFALKLTGHCPDAPHMRLARRKIHELGGADAVNSFTRFYLALLGQINYDHCPAVPPEALLLPAWFPLSIYRISAWSRTILVPLSIIWAYRPTCRIPAERGIGELFLRPPGEWPALRNPGFDDQGRRCIWERVFRALDRLLKACERWKVRPLRRQALQAAEDWMLEHFQESDGLGAIFPSIVWSTIALKCLGYGERRPELQDCRDQLERLVIREGDQLRVQPCLSPVWDTALAVRAFSAAGTAPDEPFLQRGANWLIRKQIQRRGDWAVRVNSDGGGWCFEHHNAFYPDVDDTTMVMLALNEIPGGKEPPVAATQNGSQHQRPSLPPPVQRGLRWVLAMQNSDGGWGAFDRNNNFSFLCHVPFADHNAMIDPSTPDITGRVLECLGSCGLSPEHRAVRRAVRYLRRTQEPDGSWPGRWGVNYIYGTWQVLVGLRGAGVATDDVAMQRGASWLLSCQQPCGGWGESAESYCDPSCKGVGPVTPSQTAWALLGLSVAGLADHAAVQQAVSYLVNTQQPDGSWLEPQFTGTGFPRVFYLRYHLYPIYFPLLALAGVSRHV